MTFPLGASFMNINARYYLARSKARDTDALSFDVIDRALELQFRPAVVFSNGTEQECREWVTRNCDEPGEHTPGDWKVETTETQIGHAHKITPVFCCLYVDHRNIAEKDAKTRTAKADAQLMATAPKLLALLEQYHNCLPTKESGKLIAEARGWQT
jgi:hypothetical protein